MILEFIRNYSVLGILIAIGIIFIGWKIAKWFFWLIGILILLALGLIWFL